MTIKQFNNNRGFTFIELILYVSILTIMLSAIIPFAWNVIGSSTKSATQQEVNTQARYVSERIKYEIRNANTINSVNSPINTINLNTPINPTTVIDLSGGKIRVKYGAATAVPLNSNNTTVSYLNFTDYRSADGKTENVQFTFILNSTFGSTDQRYTATTSVESDAEIRSN